MIFGYDYFAAHRNGSTGIYTVSVMIFNKHLATFAFPKTRNIVKRVIIHIVRLKYRSKLLDQYLKSGFLEAI